MTSFIKLLTKILLCGRHSNMNEGRSQAESSDLAFSLIFSCLLIYRLEFGKHNLNNWILASLIVCFFPLMLTTEHSLKALFDHLPLKLKQFPNEILPGLLISHRWQQFWQTSQWHWFPELKKKNTNIILSISNKSSLQSFFLPDQKKNKNKTLRAFLNWESFYLHLFP